MKNLFKKLFQKLLKRANDGIDADNGTRYPELNHVQPNLGAPIRLVGQQTESLQEVEERSADHSSP